MQPVGGVLPSALPRERADLDVALERARPKIERTLHTAQIPSEDAEDLLHDALARLLANWGDIDNAEAWLIATVKCATQSYWRARRRRVVDQLDAALAEVLQAPATMSEEYLDLRCDLDRQLTLLPDRCRRLLRLRFHLGLETRELAEELGYKPDSVRKVTRRCLHSLASRLSRGGYGDGGCSDR